MSKENISRRGLFKGAAALAASAALPAAVSAHIGFGMHRHHHRGVRVLRFAHLTDIHVSPKDCCALGFDHCLDHLLSQPDPPQFILNGGDTVLDAVGATASNNKAQWKTFHKVYHENSNLQVYHCIGNHDIWGWNRSASHATGKEARYGKHWAMEELGLEKPYYSFDRGGWHFIVLDSIRPARNGFGYVAKLDHEQLVWLNEDLKRTSPATPVLVMSHVPILSVSSFFQKGVEYQSCWKVPAAYMHIDAIRLKDLFVQHPNVKLCVSGHEHLQGEVKYAGVKYACNGAVSGAWWKGPYQETQPGYAMVDLFADGTSKVQYVPWGWKA